MKKEKNKRKLLLGSCLIIAVLLFALFGDLFARHDPYKSILSNALISPCKEYPCGTDNLGRCVLCRILTGAKTSVFSALTVVVIVFLWGEVLGCCQAFVVGFLILC